MKFFFEKVKRSKNSQIFQDVEDAFLSQRVETDQAVCAEIFAEHVENRGDESSEKEDSVSSTVARNDQKQEEKTTR